MARSDNVLELPKDLPVPPDDGAWWHAAVPRIMMPAGIPSATPIAVSVTLSRSSIRSTALGVAPMARRTPISRLRRTTA